MHRHYYHPSNMSFFFYGNNLIEKSLRNLDINYLSQYSNNTDSYKHHKIITPREVK